MNVNSAAVITNYQLSSGFDRQRETLLNPQFADRLSKPIAHWAAPEDRHLPMALMNRSVRELISTPFQQLHATPGVGIKKMAALLRLLARVSQEVPAPQVPLPEPANDHKGVGSLRTNLSEVHWIEWRDVVARHDLHCETLGRLSRSLQALPRSLWNTPLSTFSQLSLAEIRGLRAYGEKRVGAVLEVFEFLANVLQQVDDNPHLSVRFSSRFVERVEGWARQQFLAPAGPSVQEVRDEFVFPLLEQVLLDGGELHREVVKARLELPNLTVRALASRKGLTRGRLYELWAECATIASIRWPAGPAIMSRLQRKLLADGTNQAAQGLFDSAMAIWFPAKQGGRQLSVRSGLWQAIAQPSETQMAG